MYRQAAAVSSGVKIHLSRRLFVGCLLLALLLFAGLFATWHNREVADESESTECVESRHFRPVLISALLKPLTLLLADC